MRCQLVITLSLGLLCVVHSPIDAGVKSDCKVKASATVSNSVTNGKRLINVSLEIEDGYFLFGNPVKIDFLEESATRLKVRCSGKPVAAEVQYPAGRIVKDGKFDMSTYVGRVNIPVLIPANVDTGSLTIEIYVHANGRGICMLPSTMRINPGVTP